jgi:holo-[acyl-carrier protein] synthase
MIKGIGVDVVEIRRIEEMVRKYQDHFLSKVFTGNEIAYCEKRARPSIHYSGRWAVKEAFYKALPRECQSSSGWKSIELVSIGLAAPYIEVLDSQLKKKMAGCGVDKWHVSVSHERTACVAVVVLECAQ